MVKLLGGRVSSETVRTGNHFTCGDLFFAMPFMLRNITRITGISGSESDWGGPVAWVHVNSLGESGPNWVICVWSKKGTVVYNLEQLRDISWYLIICLYVFYAILGSRIGGSRSGNMSWWSVWLPDMLDHKWPGKKKHERIQSLAAFIYRKMCLPEILGRLGMNMSIYSWWCQNFPARQCRSQRFFFFIQIQNPLHHHVGWLRQHYWWLSNSGSITMFW